MGVDVAYIWVGIAVPVLTFIGVWIWRARMRAGHDLWDDVPGRVDEFARSVTALRGRLDEVGDQVSRWSRDLEERDRKLAERISGLIDVTEKAARTRTEAPEASHDPRQARRASGR